MRPGRKLKLPLPPGFFRCPPLTDAERRAYVVHGQGALLHLVQMCRLHGGPVAWSFDHETQGVAVYKGMFDNSVVHIRITEVQGTLEEAAHLVSVGDDGSRDYCATHFPDHVVDTQTLYTLAAPTPHHPHNSLVLKWRAVDTTLIATRDFCVLEYQDNFTVDGIDGFGRCLQSIELPTACPDLEGSFGLVRAHIRLGGDVFFRSRRDGYITVCRLYCTDMKGHSWCSTSHLYGKTQLTKGLSDVDRQLRQQRMNHSAFLPEYTLVPRHTRSHCSLCRCKLTSALLAKKYNCRKCGEVVCRQCHSTYYISDHTGGRDPAGRGSVFMTHAAFATLFKSRAKGRPSLRGAPKASTMAYRVCSACSSTPLALAPARAMDDAGFVMMDDNLSTLRSTWQVAPPSSADSHAVVTLSFREFDPQLLSNSGCPQLPNGQNGTNPRGGIAAFEEDIPIMMPSRTDFDMLEEPTPRWRVPALPHFNQRLAHNQVKEIQPTNEAATDTPSSKWAHAHLSESTSASADDEDWPLDSCR